MSTHSEVSCGGLFSKQAFAIPDFAVDPQGMTVFHVVLLSIDFCPRTGSRIRISDPPCCDVCATIDQSILSTCSVFFFSFFYFNGAIEWMGTGQAVLRCLYHSGYHWRQMPSKIALPVEQHQVPLNVTRHSSRLGSQLVEPWSLPGGLVVCGSVLDRLPSSRCCWCPTNPGF